MSYANLEGIDATSDVAAAALVSGGKKFICRYIGTGGAWKHAAKDSVDWWIHEGIHVVLVAEATGARADTDTKAEGVADAKAAQAAAAALGRGDAPIYFAIDYDAPESAQPGINAYFQGINSVIGKNRTGVYASYYVVERVAKAGLAAWFWQTYAWSGSMRSSRAHILQYRNAVNFAGATVDFDCIQPAGASGFGCCCHAGATPQPHDTEVLDMDEAKLRQIIRDEVYNCLNADWHQSRVPGSKTKMSTVNGQSDLPGSGQRFSPLVDSSLSPLAAR